MRLIIKKKFLFYTGILFFSLFLNSPSNAVPKARVIKFNPPVEVFLKNTGIWKPVSKFMSLKEGDKLRTGSNGSALLSLGRNDRIVIANNSNITLQNFSSKPPKGSADGTLAGWFQRPADRKFRMKLRKGMIFSKVSKLSKKSTYVIETPTSVVGVRGTNFGVATGTTPNGRSASAIKTTQGSVGVGPATPNGQMIAVENLDAANAAVKDLIGQIKRGEAKGRTTKPGENIVVNAGEAVVVSSIQTAPGAIKRFRYTNNQDSLADLARFFLNSGIIEFDDDLFIKFGFKLPPQINPLSSELQQKNKNQYP